MQTGQFSSFGSSRMQITWLAAASSRRRIITHTISMDAEDSQLLDDLDTQSLNELGTTRSEQSTLTHQFFSLDDLALARLGTTKEEQRDLLQKSRALPEEDLSALGATHLEQLQAAAANAASIESADAAALSALDAARSLRLAAFLEDGVLVPSFDEGPLPVLTFPGPTAATPLVDGFKTPPAIRSSPESPVRSQGNPSIRGPASTQELGETFMTLRTEGLDDVGTPDNSSGIGNHTIGK